MFLVHAEDDRLGKWITLLEELNQVISNRFGAGSERYNRSKSLV